MKFALIGLVVLLSATQVQADTPLDVVNALFDAMRAGDGAKVRSLALENAPLDRAQADGNIRRGTLQAWSEWVDRQEAGDADEQIFATKVAEFGGTANVFAPFVLHYKGNLVGCGVNQFMLAKTTEGWRISYGIDTPHSGDCKTFRDEFPDKK